MRGGVAGCVMAWSRARAQCAKLTQLARRIAGWCHEPSWRDGTWRSLVSASVWGTEGREFESRRPDHSSALQALKFVQTFLVTCMFFPFRVSFPIYNGER